MINQNLSENTMQIDIKNKLLQLNSQTSYQTLKINLLKKQSQLTKEKQYHDGTKNALGAIKKYKKCLNKFKKTRPPLDNINFKKT